MLQRRFACATWMAGLERITTESGVLDGALAGCTATGVSVPELLAAAYALSFNGMLTDMLVALAHPPTHVQTIANAGFTSGGPSRVVSCMRIVVRAIVPGLPEATFVQVARAARDRCTVAKVFRVGIVLDAALVVDRAALASDP